MKILFVSGELIGSAICQKLHKEGNEVKLYIHKRDWKKCLDGIVPKVENWQSELDWVGKEGLIIFDDVIFGVEQDKLRSDGYRVVGGSSLADKLENERNYFSKILNNHGIKTLPSYDFISVNKAIKFIKNNPDRWVVKQNGHASSLNYLGENKNNVSDVLAVLKEYKRRGISPVHIQKFAEGVEVGVARYFNGVDWIGPVEINHEHKKLLDGDDGLLTPEMGTVLWYTDENIRLFTDILGKLKPHLQEIGFRGDFDINCIINEEGAWPLEATPRFGTPASEIHVELNRSPWSDFLLAVSDSLPYDLDYSKDFGIAVSLTCSPFPYEPHIFNRIGNKIFPKKIIFNNLSEEEMKHIHFEEVSKLKDGTYKWSGQCGWVMHVTARGEDIEEAREKVYKIVSKINLPNLHYRKDIGEKVMNNDLLKLKKWGWI